MSIKAFNLIPAITKSDSIDIKISCMEICGKNLYLGTFNCEIVHLLLEETIMNNRITYKSSLQLTKNLGHKKPIIQIKAASTINRIVILSESNLLLFNMLNLENIQFPTKIKFITYFTFNSNPLKPNPFTVEIVASTSKKSILFLILKEESILQMKEIMLHENPLTLKISGSMVCIGFVNEYQMVDIVSNKIQELLIIESVKPIIVPISKNEFFLSASNALGVICTSEGVSQSPPIQLQRDIIAISYSHPYIITISFEIISIYSILDQQPKQVLTFSGGIALEKYNERLFIRTRTDIYALVSVPVEQQIQCLLDESRIDEVLLYCNSIKEEYKNNQNFQLIYNRVLQMSGFSQLSKLNFNEAHNYFTQTFIDPREILILFPGYMPSHHVYHKISPPLHNFTTIDQMVDGDSSKIHRTKRFLFEYLSDLDDKYLNSNDVRECIETALIKLHCDFSSHDQLIAYITSCKHYHHDDCIDYLKANGRFHVAGLLASFGNNHQVALDIYMKIADGDFKDKNFPGLEFIADYLSNLSDIALIWKNAQWIFNKDENIAIKIFTGSSTENFNPEEVLNFLALFPNSILKYLEYLVFVLYLEKENYHTQLAQHYSDAIVHQKAEAWTPVRTKFRNFILSSDQFQVQLILHKIISNENLLYETAILHGKLGDHKKALRIFAAQLKDFKAAEAYCNQNLSSLTKSSEGVFTSRKKKLSTKYNDIGKVAGLKHASLNNDTSTSSIIANESTDFSKKVLRSQLLFTLLSIYLEETETYFEPAMALLVKNQGLIDSLEAIKLLPSNWSLNLLRLFLIGSLRFGINQSRSTKIQKSLATTVNYSTKLKLYEHTKNKIHLSENSLCSICRKPFTDSSFSILPSRLIAHINCITDY